MNIEINPIMKYEYFVDMNAETSATKVLKMTGGSKRVLEIGAGPGSISRLLKTINNCHVTAVDNDPGFVEKLTVFCDEVVQLDLNNPEWVRAFSSHSFDVVVAADVLEHLYDPWTTLRSMKSLVAETGSIIVSLPHIGHSAAMACVMQNDFAYKESGLFDRTHIRFFGLNNINSLFDQAGLKIVAAEFVVLYPEQTELADYWAKAPKSMRKILSKTKYANVYQIVVQAEPKDSMRPEVDILSLSVPKPMPLLRVASAPEKAFRDLMAPVFRVIRKCLRVIIFSRSLRDKLRSLVRRFGGKYF